MTSHVRTLSKIIKIAWETDQVDVLEFDSRGDAIIFMNEILTLTDDVLTTINAGIADDAFKTMLYVESKGINEAITEFRVSTEDARLYSYLLM
jgi:hypothetical protein